MLSGKPPDCTTCPPNGYVLAIPENYEVLELITYYQTSFVNSMMGFNANSIIQIMELEGVQDKIKTLRKIILYLSVYLSKRSEEQDGKKYSTRLRGNRQSVVSGKQGYFRNK